MNRRALFWIQTLVNVALTGALYALVGNGRGPLAHGAILILLPILGFRSFALMHEAAHGLLSRHKLVNDFWGLVWGAVALLPHDPWRFSHRQHHKWAGNIVKDPSMALVTALPRLPRPILYLLNLSWRTWLPTLGVLQHAAFWAHAIRLTFKGAGRRAGHHLSLLAPILFLFSLGAVSGTATMHLTLIFAYGFYFVAIEAVNFPHHLRLPHLRPDEHLPPKTQYRVTRSCLYPRWLSHTLLLNFNHHTEHHLAPHLAWHELGGLHIKLKKAGHPMHIDRGLRWIVAHRRLHLLDLIAESDETHHHGVRAAANE